MKKTCTISFLLAMGIIFGVVWPLSSWCDATAHGTTPEMKASLSRSSAELGSLVTLTIQYHLPEGTSLPEKLPLKGLEGLTVVKQELAPDTIRIVLLVDKLDSLSTDTLSLAYVDANGKTGAVTAAPVSLKVLSNLGDKPEDAELRPIQGIVPTSPVWRRYLPWAGGALIIAIVLAGISWWLKKRQRQSLNAELVDPPHIRAKREIESLISSRLFEKGRVKAFYFSFSQILRRYLEALRGFPAAELTTEEIAASIDNDSDRELIYLLREADLVKFADAVPTTARKNQEIQDALAYITQTAPLDETAGPASNGRNPGGNAQ